MRPLSRFAARRNAPHCALRRTHDRCCAAADHYSQVSRVRDSRVGRSRRKRCGAGRSGYENCCAGLRQAARALMVARRVPRTVSRSSSFPACGAVSVANARLGTATPPRTSTRAQPELRAGLAAGSDVAAPALGGDPWPTTTQPIERLTRATTRRRKPLRTVSTWSPMRRQKTRHCCPADLTGRPRRLACRSSTARTCRLMADKRNIAPPASNDITDKRP